MLKKASKQISNIFWKEILITFSKLSEEIPFAHPHLFFHLNIFQNKLFGGNGIFIEKQDFPELWQKSVLQIGDFYNCMNDPPTLLSLTELNEKYQIRINFLRYLRIKAIIENAAKCLDGKIYDQNKSDTKLPRLPLLLKLGCFESKGCRTFYRTFRSREETNIMNNRTYVDKWHEALETKFSASFWDQIWKMQKKSLMSNKTKWVSIQINRHILPTNYTVNQYDKSVNPGCSLCNQSHIEKLHLFLWGCHVVQDFWVMISNILTFYFPKFKLNKKEAIFGDITTNGDSVINTILFLARQFIYKQKFTSKTLDEVIYINYMKQELKFLHHVHLIKGESVRFMQEWSRIFDHFEVGCTLGGSGEIMLN